MKKFFFLCLLVCYSVVLSSCIEIVQHITEKADGTIQNTVRITVSKALLAMAAGMNGNPEPLNYDEVFEQFGVNEQLIQDNELFPINIKKVNDPNDIGYLIDMTVDYRNTAIQEALVSDITDFIPMYRKKMMIISITDLKESNTDINNEMAEVFFSSSKYRLLVNKSVMPTISTVVVRTASESSEVHFLDLYNEFLIEIPIIVFMKNEANIEIYR